MNKTFNTREELYDYLRENKTMLKMHKQATVKYADACVYSLPTEEAVDKATPRTIDITDRDKFNVKAVINTTNILDSHDDVHMPGLWNKTLKEQKNLYLLQEHDMSFKSIISDNVKASVEQLTWKQLGEKYSGEAEALVFDAEIDTQRNAYMAEQYAKGYVKNHSVGMRYVKLALAMNSQHPSDAEEFATWNKYISQVANKAAAEERGYFWAVTEAKLIEGSAVPMGSNQVTPTLEVKAVEPLQDTQQVEEPAKATPSVAIDWFKVAQAINTSNH